jgi:serine/threonine protein kinase/Tol biopolymer transport system component
MRLAAGTRLGPYEILAPLGAGGMGEVYRARDTRLGRDVAVKVLPQHLSENPDVHARFEREARTISSLNHPHICTLHDVGRDQDVEYLVMELIEGETLAQRLEKGALAIPEVLKLGIQIADALDRAHRAGIVHRDFKPGNVMLAKGGAKLTDFGLARNVGAVGGQGGSGVTIAHLSQSPTVASPLTAEGSIVGTFLYMPPEQLEGRETDARSDIWALGCVLYEMATGRRAFEGKSQASLIGSIMNSEPVPVGTLAPFAPPALDGLIRACLAKDPEERIQTAHDVKLQLTWIAQSGSSPSAVAAPAVRRRGPAREAIAWGVAGVALALLGLFAWRGRSTTPAQQIRFTVPLPQSVSGLDLPRVSPDGRTIAFSAQDSTGRTMIWVRPLNALIANPLPGTERAGRPFWSPDSRFLAFVADGKMKKVALAGGPPVVICDAPTGYDGSWGRDGVILYDGGNTDPIRRVNASGGIPTEAMPPDTAFQVGWPAFLPDGKHYFYTKLPASGPPRIMLGTLGKPRGRELGITGSRVECSPDGYLLFARERTLLAQQFDLRAMKLRGEPFPVAENLPVSASGQANFTVSDNGVLVYRTSGVVLNRITWLDRSGRDGGPVTAAGDYRAPALSPDGSRIALRRREADGANIDVWIIQPARGTTTRFTFDPGFDGNPIWSPDGSQIAWTSDRGGSDALWLKSAGGLGQDQMVTKVGANAAALDWSRDGKWILLSSLDARTGLDLWTVDMAGERKPTPLLQTQFNERRARFSPDGRWIAYDSDETGRPEVYVASFQGSTGKFQVSANGGTYPCWSPDGRELYYISSDQQLMSVAVNAGVDFNAATPVPLFRVQSEQGIVRNVYEVSPDGKRFLFVLPAGDTGTPITAVVNWRGDEHR